MSKINTRCAVKIEDNDLLVQWSRFATAAEGSAVSVADIINRLIERHKNEHGNGNEAYPRCIQDGDDT